MRQSVRVNLDAPFDRDPLHLELGCGSAKHDPLAVGIDVLPAGGVDIVNDALTVLRELPDASVDRISSYHFLEHIDEPEAVVREAARVLRTGGLFEAEIPYFANPWFYSDATHRTHFGLYTFAYWVESTPYRRKTPHYREPAPFEMLPAVYHFKSSRPFYGRHVLKMAIGWGPNVSRWTQEFYEENLCWLFPAHEIRYVLRRL